MFHQQLPHITPPTAHPLPAAKRSSRLRAGAVFASAVAIMGAAVLATAPAGAADPFPQCGDPNPANCPAGSDIPGVAQPCSPGLCHAQLPPDLASPGPDIAIAPANGRWNDLGRIQGPGPSGPPPLPQCGHQAHPWDICDPT
jgi:hypothetical protein